MSPQYQTPDVQKLISMLPIDSILLIQAFKALEIINKKYTADGRRLFLATFILLSYKNDNQPPPDPSDVALISVISGDDTPITNPKDIDQKTEEWADRFKLASCIMAEVLPS